MSRTFLSMEEAQRWGAGVEYGFVSPTSNKACDAMVVTLADVCALYKAQVSARHKGSRQEQYRLREIEQQVFARLPITKITPEQIRHYRDRLITDGLSGGSVLWMLSLLSSVFRYARDELGMELDNPVARVRKPKPSKARVRRLSADEEARLMVSLAQCKHPQVERVSRFLLETAMRRSEALGLVWQQVDLVRRLVTLSDSKNGHPRWIPLTSRACELLQCAGAPNEAVFPISESALSQAWGHAVRRAGIEDLRLHDLRHEALSRWAHRLNGDVFKLAMISGHRTLQMAQRYVHPVQSELLASAMYE